MKYLKHIRLYAFLPLQVVVFSGASAAQEEGKAAESEEMTTAEYDRYWGDGENRDMSIQATALTSPESFHLEEDGYLVMECEAQPFNENWELMEEPKGFLGSGYLKYVGENLQGNHDGHNTDIYVQYQQDIEDRLIFPIRITHAGTYRARTRVFHNEKDGDNDAWINLMRTPRRATRFGGKSAGEFHWNKFGWDGEELFKGKFNTFKFKAPGDYLLYIGGRSTGFGVDRLILHRDERQSIALDVNTPTSKMVEVDQ